MILNFMEKRAHSSMINESSNINAVMFLSKLLELNKYFKRECVMNMNLSILL